MQKFKRYSRGGKEENVVRNYAAIDLGTNSCRLVIASPTPTSFHIIETFSRITRLGEGIIKRKRVGQRSNPAHDQGVEDMFGDHQRICADFPGAFCGNRCLSAGQKL